MAVILNDRNVFIFEETLQRYLFPKRFDLWVKCVHNTFIIQ